MASTRREAAAARIPRGGVRAAAERRGRARGVDHGAWIRGRAQVCSRAGKDERGIHQGLIKNTSEYALLAGPMSMYMDNMFFTKIVLFRVSRIFCFSLLEPALMVCILNLNSSSGCTSRSRACSESTLRSRFPIR